MQRNHSVRGATVLVVAHVGAIEIEVSVRLVAGFAGGRDNWGNLPVQSHPRSHFAIGEDRVIEPRDSVRVPEVVRLHGNWFASNLPLRKAKGPCSSRTRDAVLAARRREAIAMRFSSEPPRQEAPDISVRYRRSRRERAAG